MYYSIKPLTEDDYPEIEKLAQITEIDERIDYNCKFWGAWGDNGVRRLYGVVGINFNKEHYPQFEHIILRPERQKTKLAIILLRFIEKMLRDEGYKTWVAFIRNDRNFMQSYALKFGMRAYANNDNGVWFYKELKKENVCI